MDTQVMTGCGRAPLECQEIPAETLARRGFSSEDRLLSRSSIKVAFHSWFKIIIALSVSIVTIPAVKKSNNSVIFS